MRNRENARRKEVGFIVQGHKAVSALVDLSVLRRGVLTQDALVQKTIRWAGRDFLTPVAAWMPKPQPKESWLRRQIECLPTISRLARESKIVLYTYSELEFEEWQGRRGMQGTFGDCFLKS